MRKCQPASQLCVKRVRKLIQFSKSGLTTDQICRFIHEFSNSEVEDALEELRDVGLIAIANKRWYWRMRKTG